MLVNMNFTVPAREDSSILPAVKGYNAPAC